MTSSTTNRYYSTTNKKGEINELKEALNNTKNENKIEGLKKTIAFMTIGKDVSSLFQPVIKCLEMNHLEIKKLVYLYIINYSRSKPDDAIMIINCLPVLKVIRNNLRIINTSSYLFFLLSTYMHCIG